MDKQHYPKQQNNDVATPIDFVKIKHVNRLKNRKAKNTANNFNTLGRGRNFRTFFDSIV